MSDESDIDIEGGLADLLRRGEAERRWDDAEGEWVWWLTEKGKESAAKLIKEMTRKDA